MKQKNTEAAYNFAVHDYADALAGARRANLEEDTIEAERLTKEAATIREAATADEKRQLDLIDAQFRADPTSRYSFDLNWYAIGDAVRPVTLNTPLATHQER